MTEGEGQLAFGEPVSGWLALIGASQGLLTQLRMNGLNIRSKNLMPSPFAKVSLPGLVIGGALVGYGFGVMFFGDDQLRRLAMNHN